MVAAWRGGLLIQALLMGAIGVTAQPFRLPTANRALFEKGGEERFFVGTAGKPWITGTFGCVRSEGGQMHEGLDIRSLQRDKKGEPIDPVLATSDGTVAYINRRPSLSNYGNYVILRHKIEGLEIYSLYAHLREIASNLKLGQAVKAGEPIAIMGRTANTREGISKDRAHVHFELDLLVNEGFPVWYKQKFPGQRNDHAGWNGRNLIGLDPRLILLEQQRLGPKFSLVEHIRRQTELCRVVVRDQKFPWLQRYKGLVRPNPLVDKEGIAGYELALNFNGLIFELIPRASSEIKGKARIQLLSVNAAEQQKNPARHLVTRKRAGWELTRRGTELLELLVY